MRQLQRISRTTLVLLCLTAIFACGRFEAYKPPANSIVYIRQDNSLFSPSSYDPTISPVPLPQVDDGIVSLANPAPVQNADTRIEPHQSVGRLNIARDDGSSGHCTATLISNTNIIMTAAHCLYTANDGWIDDVQFALRAGGVEPELFGWRCAALNRRWIDSNPGDRITFDQIAVDIAFVLLDRPTSSPINLASTLSPTVSVSGYPAKHNSGRIMITGTASVTQVANGVLQTSIDLGPGASGSAYVNNLQAVGALSAGNPTGMHYAAPVNDFARQLQAFVEADCPSNEGTDGRTLASLPSPPLLYIGGSPVLRLERVQYVPNPGALDCRFICSSPSPLCDSVETPFDLNDEFREMAELVMQQQTVTKAEIMRLFGQTEDECNRTDLTIEDGNFSNSGETPECYATLSDTIQTNGSSIDVELVVSFPQHVIGSIDYGADNLDATFAPDASPIALFNRDPTSIFSGAIRRIFVEQSTAILEVGRSCLLMDIR